MRIDNRESSSVFIVTLLFPIVGLIMSLANWRKPWAKNIFWLVCAFMGAIQIYQREGISLGEGSDAGRYALELVYMHNNVNSFSEVSQTFFDGDTNDIFQPTLTYIVSRFTSNGHVFFFFVALVFGFFYSRNIWYILDKLPENIPKGLWVLIVYFFLVCPIWFINGVRMWTALHIFVYGALPFVLEGKRNCLIWSLLSILVHHSFILPIAILGVYVLLAKPVRQSTWILTAFFVFYIVSLTIKTLNISAFADVLNNYLPDYYDDRVSAYTNERVIENRQAIERRETYITIFDTIKFWSVQILVVVSFVMLRLKSFVGDKKYIPLFSLSLLMYGIANIASLVPSGGRYTLIALMLLVSAFLLVFSHYPILKVRWLFNLSMYLLGFALLFDIRMGLDFYGIMLLMGNFITIFFVEFNVPLIEFIKMVF